MINVNTHHAYLNTEIVLSSNHPSTVVLKDELTDIEYAINSEPVKIKLCAGKHKLICNKLDEEINIEIEDAIKIGGSKLKSSFVFDENVWAFVVTKDRLYATNLETLEEKVEYNLSPDEIIAFSDRYRRSSDYFLLRTNQDYSIFNIVTGTNIITFTNHIFSNYHLVVYQTEKKIIVFNYLTGITLVEFEEQYSFSSNSLYFVKEGKLYSLNLISSYIETVDGVGQIGKESILVGNRLLKLCEKKSLKRYTLSILSKRNVRSTIEIKTPYYIESFEDVETNEYNELVSTYKLFKQDNKDFFQQYSDFEIGCTGIRIEDFSIKWEKQKEIFSIKGKIISYPAKTFDIPFVIKNDRPSLQFKDMIVDPSHCNNENTDEKNINILNDREIKLKNGTQNKGTNEKILGCSNSGNLAILLKNNQIFLYNSIKDESIRLLKNSFDTDVYYKAFFSSDGKNVIFGDKNNNMGILGLEDMIQQPFEIEGASVARLSGINGYKPEINLSGRIPVWRDPISLKRLKENAMRSHVFMSHDGKFLADMQMKKIYHNRLTGKDISDEKANALKEKYDWVYNTSEDEKNKKIKLRELLIKRYGVDLIFGTNDKITLDSKIKHTSQFSQYFIERLCYVCYKEIDKLTEKRILIGKSVWFLNYVSFSYDSRYLAFGAKLVDDHGIFEIYDLINEKIVSKDEENSLMAVWMTIFNRNGDVAYYDSSAKTIVAYAESDYEETQVANGKSLLCFSPSGKYIALSDQNYISYLYHPESNWGHQPSGNVYIYKTEDLENCLGQYNDLGEGIDGVSISTRKAGNIASAAFSSDEKRILMVGEDGVIVIRNLFALHAKEQRNNKFERLSKKHKDLLRYLLTEVGFVKYEGDDFISYWTKDNDKFYTITEMCFNHLSSGGKPDIVGYYIDDEDVIRFGLIN